MIRRSVERSTLVAVVVALLALLAAAPAQADFAAVPAGAAAPGSDPNHATPLELLASRIASTIAGRSVSVRCNDETGWNTIAADVGFDPNAELGVVVSPFYYVETGRFLSSATATDLSPTACSSLQQFAQATAKPTKCRAKTTATKTVTRYRLVTRYRWVTSHGRRTRVAYRVKAPYTATIKQTVLAPPSPCFLGTPVSSGSSTLSECWDHSCYAVAAREPSSFWNVYDQDAQAILALAHEPIHLWQDQAGAAVPPDTLVESQAECSGMQWMAYVAEQLGDTPDDAQAIATYFWTIGYPSLQSTSDPYSQSHPYWSADCVPGGALDIRAAGSTAWP